MRVVNRKFLYKVNKLNNWAQSHCHKPTPIIIDDTTIRVYFGVRDKQGITRTTFVDLDAQDITDLKVKYVYDKPVLDLGKLGTFDDSGVNVSSIVRISKHKLYMYYIGWNPSLTVPTRNSIGIAVSEDNGTTFYRLFDSPIVDRNKFDPYYIGAVDVKIVNGLWLMWYTSGTEWKIINGKPEIKYHIKYAYSLDGITWKRNNIDCILPDDEFSCAARPSVFFKNNKYYMLYSKRKMIDFRTDKNNSYRCGYAVSENGVYWEERDNNIVFNPSNKGFDSDSIAYPYVLKVKNEYLVFYNGNKFGETGFGYGKLKWEKIE